MSSGFPTHNLTPELAEKQKEIIALAKSYGLSFFPIKFLLVSPKELNAVAAQGGFPARIPHWTNGMEFENVHKKYQYGASKIYELVINTNPVYAYLLLTNPLVDQKLVMAHVCGHADFFLNNCWFSKTDRDMLNQMANNASRVRRIALNKGDIKVEEFLDVCYSLQNLVDPYQDHIKRQYPVKDEDEDDDAEEVPRLRAKEYMDPYINSKDYLASEKAKIKARKEQEKNFPVSPDRDVLGFLCEHSEHLEPWQRHVLAMVREESYYFAPQMMTKIMNEGWASYWHSKMMTKHLAEDKDIIDYCERHASTISQGQSINPYRIGLLLYKDIEDRWNKGRFGQEWEDCDDAAKRANWDKELGLGKEKIFQVRKTHNDLTFIDEFLTEDFCRENELFAFRKVPEVGGTETTHEFKQVKTQFLQMLTNAGQPIIQVVDGNYQNRGELYLEHVHDGLELEQDKGKATLENLFAVWGRPCHVETLMDGQTTLWSYDGKEHQKTAIIIEE